MNSKLRTALVISILLLFLIGGAYLYIKNQLTYSWELELDEIEENQPYSVSTFYSLLNNEFNSFSKAPKDYANLSKDTLQTLFVLGESFLMDEEEFTPFIEWIEGGNDAFFSVTILAHDWLDSLSKYTCLDGPIYLQSVYTEEVNPWCFHPNLQQPDTVNAINFRQNGKKSGHRWAYFPETVFCVESRVELFPSYYSEDYNPMMDSTSANSAAHYNSTIPLGGYLDDQINFIRFQVGEGFIYLHTTPEVFTNYTLDSPDRLLHANNLLAHLRHPAILWETEHLASQLKVTQQNLGSNGLRGKRKIQPSKQMDFVFENKPLRWAWFCLVGVLGAYLVFGIQRKQRIIPVKRTKENTSAELIEAIGRLTFEQNNHKEAALEAFELMLRDIRKQYKLQTDNFGDDTFLAALAAKSGIPEVHFRKTGQMQRNINSSNYVSENVLIQFTQLIDYYYENRK